MRLFWMNGDGSAAEVQSLLYLTMSLRTPSVFRRKWFQEKVQCRLNYKILPGWLGQMHHRRLSILLRIAELHEKRVRVERFALPYFTLL